MNAASIRPWLPPLLITAGVAAIAASVAGIATVTGSLPGSYSRGSTPVAGSTAAPAMTAPGTPACATCGVVESVREVGGKRAAGVEVRLVASGTPGDAVLETKRVSYRVTVRMDDGSYRTLSQPAPPAVAVGDPVRVADGAVVTRP
jgi:hypothetical protein